ncbi:MAG: endolytic transglycosylase MltG [Ferruginibacter sp.]|nr:endolytic transglycosylase MltG [Ferruginibacter sp.]
MNRKKKKYTKRKKIIIFIACFFLVLITALGSYFAWVFYSSSVSSPPQKYFFIKAGSSYEDVRQALIEQKIISNGTHFDYVAGYYGYKNKIKSGRYEIKDKSSLVSLVKMLKSGKQAPARLTITKIRTREDLAIKLDKTFQLDSITAITFLNNNDSLKSFGLDTNTILTAIIPNSYNFWWESSMPKIISRLKDQADKFWNGERSEKAKKLGLTPNQVYIIASIVEEETNVQDDKGKIASVYINRLQKGINLEACPSVKFALKDFGLKRILFSHLKVASPYNTYINPGLPPGPLCTPSISTIDAVLNSPKTDFLFFAAKSDFKGYSVFATNLSDHQRNARLYQQALDSITRLKNLKKSSEGN